VHARVHAEKLVKSYAGVIEIDRSRVFVCLYSQLTIYYNLSFQLTIYYDLNLELTMYYGFQY
jgi:hypothetical protein